MKTTKRKTKSARVGSAALGHGVFVVHENGDPVRFEARQLPTLIRLLGPKGEKVMHGFLVALNACERITSTAHLMGLNGDHVKTIAGRRNHHTLIWTMLSTLYEALEAIRLLDGGGVTGLVGKSFKPWQDLRKLKQRWEDDDFLVTARNATTHLAGDELLVGLRSLKPTGRMVLFDHSGGKLRRDTTFPIVLEVLLLGLRDKNGKPFEKERFERSGRQATVDATRFEEDIVRVFSEVLRGVGVALPEGLYVG